MIPAEVGVLPRTIRLPADLAWPRPLARSQTVTVPNPLWRVCFWVTAAASFSCATLASYFIWRSTTESGANCTFDHLDCATNRHLGRGLSWLLLSILLAGACLVISIARRRSARRT